MLQIDDPALVDLYDWWFSAEDDIARYRKWAAFQVEAVNHALEGIPGDRCATTSAGAAGTARTSPTCRCKDIVDLVIKVHAQGVLLEAGNVRHEHEWQVWRDVKLPEGKMLMPGVVSHATNVVEHPELVADRIVSRQPRRPRKRDRRHGLRVLGGRVHPQLVWAKLRLLSEGAALASKQLW